MINYNDLTKNIKDGLKFPTGATSERGNPSKGSLRFNSETGKPEIYAKSRGWKTEASSGSYSYLTTDLLVDLDAANSNSYSGSGSTWTDLQGNLNMQKDPNNNSAYTNTGYNSNGWFEMGPDRYPNWMDYPHSWASTSDVDSLLSGTSFSMDIWVRFISDYNQDQAYRTLVSQGYHDYGIILSEYTINSGNINFNNYYAHNSGGLTSWIHNVNLPIVDFGDRWVHLVYTYEESTVDYYGDYLPGGSPSNLIKFYVDGAFVAEDYSRGGVGTNANGAYGMGPLRLGGAYNSSHSNASVDLSSFRLYDKTLSATEIADNFNNTKSRFGL